MSDSAVHIGENSPEQVAFNLMMEIAKAEQKAFHKQASGGYTSADRKWILDTYAECLLTVKAPSRRFP